MSVFVDLSAEQLSPEAVVALIRAQCATSSVEDILFNVSHRTLALFCGQKPSDAVEVSESELAKLNDTLRGAFSVQDFLVRTKYTCTGCAKTLTFFDFFESGREVHGDDLMGKWF